MKKKHGLLVKPKTTDVYPTPFPRAFHTRLPHLWSHRQHRYTTLRPQTHAKL